MIPRNDPNRAINHRRPLIFIYSFDKSVFAHLWCMRPCFQGWGHSSAHTADRALPARLELTVRAGRGPEANKHAKKRVVLSARKKNPGHTQGEGEKLCDFMAVEDDRGHNLVD